MRFIECMLLAVIGGIGSTAIAQPILSEGDISQPRGGAGLVARDMLPGQTGGDKRPISESGKKGHRTLTAATTELNPQPLPPGKRHYYRRHRRHRIHSNAITVKQK